MPARNDSPTRRRSDVDVVGNAPKLRILAVDDDSSYLGYLKLVLTRAGFDMETATDGAAAIERLRRDSQIDLLLIDLAMPELDGIETVRQIQQECHAPELYSILLTARASLETKLRALENGLDDFLPKSSSDTEIVAKIRSAARRLEMERRLHLQNEELQALAMTDDLTGIANRRAIFRAAEDILRSERQLAVVLFDLDRFKAINDTYGHLTGDRILANVAATLKANTRYGDIIGRYGGDEFLLLLPDTEIEEARQISDRLLTKIRQLVWTLDSAVLSVGAQRGIAMVGSGMTLADAIALCDEALYRRKRQVSEAPLDRELHP